MTQLMTGQSALAPAIEMALIGGDLSKLSSAERISLYMQTCKSTGLNPLTRPFEYVTLNGKLQLYAKKDCTDQLRSIHTVSINITSRELIGDVYVVTARAKLPSGREDESTGAVCLSGKGEMLANLYMKAETKAKRRVTLSICGLGLLDETEVDSIPNARRLDAEEVETEDAHTEHDTTDPKPLITITPKSPTESAEKKLTDKQVNRYFAILRTSGVPVGRAVKYMVDNFHKTELPKLTWLEYDELCAWLQKQTGDDRTS